MAEDTEPTSTEEPEASSTDDDSAAKTAKATAAGSDGAKAPVKKKVVSKRVTPKGGGQAGSTAAHAHAPDGHDASGSSRYTPPSSKYDQLPSPTWVPVLMFALFGLGCLIIVLNYARVFGEPDNMRLIIGLAAILGGIITATNYR